MSADSSVSHRCPHCGQANGWRGPLRDSVRFEAGRSMALGRCRRCNAPVLARENPLASCLMAVAFFSLLALFVHGAWPLPAWGVLAAMAVFSAALLAWLLIRVTGMGFLLRLPTPRDLAEGGANGATPANPAGPVEP